MSRDNVSLTYKSLLSFELNFKSELSPFVGNQKRRDGSKIDFLMGQTIYKGLQRLCTIKKYKSNLTMLNTFFLENSFNTIYCYFMTSFTSLNPLRSDLTFSILTYHVFMYGPILDIQFRRDVVNFQVIFRLKWDFS